MNGLRIQGASALGLRNVAVAAALSLTDAHASRIVVTVDVWKRDTDRLTRSMKLEAFSGSLLIFQLGFACNSFRIRLCFLRSGSIMTHSINATTATMATVAPAICPGCIPLDSAVLVANEAVDVGCVVVVVANDVCRVDVESDVVVGSDVACVVLPELVWVVVVAWELLSASRLSELSGWGRGECVCELLERSVWDSSSSGR